MVYALLIFLQDSIYLECTLLKSVSHKLITYHTCLSVSYTVSRRAQPAGSTSTDDLKRVLV